MEARENIIQTDVKAAIRAELYNEKITSVTKGL